MLYTKNGSIPQKETDGTSGWLEVEDKPECPEGKEVVWLNWQWLIRDPKPENREGYVWKWNHEFMQWLEFSLINSEVQSANLNIDYVTASSNSDDIHIQ